jgi:uncharacterized membrane protein YcgQ (UPF0703/DUF1980 family)
MDIFSIDITPQELAFIRQALDLVTISGKDAKFVSNLQTRIEDEMIQIQKLKEQAKSKELQKELQIDSIKHTSKK